MNIRCIFKVNFNVCNVTGLKNIKFKLQEK
jgi:hypothetical protein